MGYKLFIAHKACLFSLCTYVDHLVAVDLKTVILKVSEYGDITHTLVINQLITINMPGSFLIHPHTLGNKY